MLFLPLPSCSDPGPEPLTCSLHQKFPVEHKLPTLPTEPPARPNNLNKQSSDYAIFDLKIVVMQSHQNFLWIWVPKQSLDLENTLFDGMFKSISLCWKGVANHIKISNILNWYSSHEVIWHLIDILFILPRTQVHWKLFHICLFFGIAIFYSEYLLSIVLYI